MRTLHDFYTFRIMIMQCWARAEGGEALYLFYSLSSIIREEEAPPAGCHTTSDARTRVGSSSGRGRKHLEHRGSGLHHVHADDKGQGDFDG